MDPQIGQPRLNLGGTANPGVVPQALYQFADEELAGPIMGDHDTLNQITNYVENLNYDQALTQVTQASRTDLLSATPTQQYIHDTRNSLWSLSTNSVGPALTNDIWCTLTTVEMVDLSTTRLRGSVSIYTAAAGQVSLHPQFFENLFMMGIQVGNNGMYISDASNTSTQPWINTARVQLRNLREQNTGVSATTDVISAWYANPATTRPQRATVAVDDLFAWSAEFNVRPPHDLFKVAKLWPANIPLRLQIKWSQDHLKNLVKPVGAAVITEIVVQLESIVSEEVHLHPELKSFINQRFVPTDSSNITALNALSNRAGLPQNLPLVDPTLGFSAYNPENITAIYQFPCGAIQQANTVNRQFRYNPVLTGGLRPSKLMFSFNATNSLVPGEAVLLNGQYQVFYDGRAVFWKPQSVNELYMLAQRVLNADTQQDRKMMSIAEWSNARLMWAIIDLAPSHNVNDVQPARATQITIQVDFDADPPPGTNLNCVMFYDQTLLISKSNEAALSLPIPSQ